MLGNWSNEQKTVNVEEPLEPRGERRSGADRREVTLSSMLDDAAARNGEMSNRTAKALGLSEKVGPMTLKDLIKELIDMFDEVGNIPVGIVVGEPLPTRPITVVGYDEDEDWITIK